MHNSSGNGKMPGINETKNKNNADYLSKEVDGICGLVQHNTIYCRGDTTNVPVVQKLKDKCFVLTCSLFTLTTRCDCEFVDNCDSFVLKDRNRFCSHFVIAVLIPIYSVDINHSRPCNSNSSTNCSARTMVVLIS